MLVELPVLHQDVCGREYKNENGPLAGGGLPWIVGVFSTAKSVRTRRELWLLVGLLTCAELLLMLHIQLIVILTWRKIFLLPIKIKQHVLLNNRLLNNI